MKKVIGIFLMMVMVFTMMTVAFGDTREEIINYCENDKRNFGQYITGDEFYNIVGDCAYAIANFEGCGHEDDIRDFMAFYQDYLAENWPEFAEDVNVSCTYAGSTENYRLYCIWLELNNGKVFSDYVTDIPDVSVMSGMLALNK